MAVRFPIYYTSGNMKENNTTINDNIRDRAVELYLSNPSVSLGVVASAGSLASITDTRKSAGAYKTFTTRYPTEAETAEPGTVTITYDRFDETVATLSAPADTGSKRFPVFNNGGNIRAMTLTDMYDTYLKPAIDVLQATDCYYVHTSTTPPTGYTLVSSTVVYADTRANTGAYTANAIPEALDQPTTITNYYLHSKNSSPSNYIELPYYIDVNNNLRQYSAAEFDDVLEELIRYVATNITDYKLRYNVNGAGNVQGSGMSNTILNGAGNHETRYVNTNDYRAQEFPDGTAVTASTHYLRLNKVA